MLSLALLETFAGRRVYVSLRVTRRRLVPAGHGGFQQFHRPALVKQFVGVEASRQVLAVPTCGFKNSALNPPA